MEFDVSCFYDAPSAELEGKRAFLSNSLDALFYLLKEEDFARLSKVSMSADEVPFKDEEGNFYKYAYWTKAFDSIESPSTRIFNELTKLPGKGSVDAMRDALEKIPGYIVRDLVHELLEWDCVLDELKESGFVSSDDMDAIVDIVNNDADMSEAVFQYYKDNSLSDEDKAELVKDWVRDLL